MSAPYPYSITKGDDGLSVKVEWDVHYLTDEQIGTVRKYVAETEAENAKLRELVRGLVYATHPADRARLIADAAELVSELGVDA